MDGKQLVDYACLRFEEGKYDEALDAFVLAYSKGIEREWILDNIYNCYVVGNETEFRTNYAHLEGQTAISYEDCLLDFIPYSEGEYYIFDKEQQIFLRKVSVQNMLEKVQMDIFQTMEFSAAAVVLDWDWEKEIGLLAESEQRKIYAICRDLRRCSSFLKLPELATYFRNIKLFDTLASFQSYFHVYTAEYLPKIVLAAGVEAEHISNVIKEEHKYRLTAAGRNTDNILLTIGIPTHERGNLVRKRLENLLPMMYDSEIEIAISKNGNQWYQEDYNKIAENTDARINYYDHGKEINPTVNWQYVVKMAHGKYVLIVSDEDDVVIDALEHYLKVLTDHPDMNLVRAASRIQVPTDELLYGKKGSEAFKYEFARQNYLSGLIVRRKDFLQGNFEELNKYGDNPYYQCYPHEWWCAIMSQMGDYMQETYLLIDEQDAVAGDEARRAHKKAGIAGEGDEDIWGPGYVPDFGTYKERLRQFEGQLVLIRLIANSNKEILEIGLKLAIGKTAWLFELARKRNYDVENYFDMLDCYVTRCMQAVDEFELEEIQKDELLEWIGYCYVHMYNAHQRLVGGSTISI